MKTSFLQLILLGFLPVLSHAFEIEYLGASERILSNPHDLKLSADGRYLYVSDVGHDRITILDPESLKPVGSFGADEQSGTHDIDIDADSTAYVADTHNNRVLIYRLAGDKATRIDVLSERIRGPEGVLAHPNGKVYVAGAWSGNLVAYAAGKVASELDGLSSPHDVELAADGNNIWLADAGNDRLLLLTPELKIIREYSGAPYDFDGVRYLDLMDDGLIVAADKNNHQVKLIAADGSLVKVLGSGRAGIGPNQFTTPEGVEIRGNTIWLSDSGNNRVVKYRVMK